MSEHVDTREALADGERLGGERLTLVTGYCDESRLVLARGRTDFGRLGYNAGPDTIGAVLCWRSRDGATHELDADGEMSLGLPVVVGGDGALCAHGEVELDGEVFADAHVTVTGDLRYGLQLVILAAGHRYAFGTTGGWR